MPIYPRIHDRVDDLWAEGPWVAQDDYTGSELHDPCPACGAEVGKECSTEDGSSTVGFMHSLRLVSYAEPEHSVEAETLEGRFHAATGPSFPSDGLAPFLREMMVWSRRRFPEATPESCAKHLRREAAELVRHPTDPHELADCLLLLTHAAYRAGVDLTAAAREKFEINKARTWGEPDTEGVREHLAETPSREVTVHELETWPQPFGEVVAGRKSFELRPDAAFAVGDILRLREYEPGPDKYTGREAEVKVSYVFPRDAANGDPTFLSLHEGWVILGLEYPEGDLLADAEQREDALRVKADEAAKELAVLKGRKFPLMLGYGRKRWFPEAPGYILWSVIEHHEAQAQRNHSQSLEELARRGGLDPTEALAVMTNRRYYDLAKEKLTDAEVTKQLWTAVHRQTELQRGPSPVEGGGP